MAQYGTLITNIGLAQIANAQITQTKVGLEYIALGDGNGAHYVPKQNQTALVHEVWRGPIAELSIDPTNSNRIIIDAVIPVTAGGFTIREIGIFDEKNNLIAIGQYPEKYKPQLSEGVSEETLIHFVIETNNADVVKLTIDPTVIIASRNYVDGKVAQVQTALTEHSEQMKPKVDNSWQKGVKNDVSVMNLSDHYAEKVIFFPNSSWKSNTNVEVLSITIPFDGRFSGTVKLAITTYWGGSESHGGATALFQVGSYDSSGVKLNNMTIETISTTFARDYYISGAVFNGTNMIIEVRKAPSASNPMTVSLAVQGYATGAKCVFTATNEATVTSMDTGSPTAGGYPWTAQTSSFVTKNGSNVITGLLVTKEDVVIEGGVRSLVFRTPNQSHYSLMRFNANNENDLGFEFIRNGVLAMSLLKDGSILVRGNDGILFNLADLKSSVSDGKAAVNQAVTDMGVYTAPDASYATTAANIRNLSNIKAGTGTITSDNLRTTFAVSGLPFKPRAIMLQARNANIQAKGMYNEQFTASEFLILINGNGMNNTFSVFNGGFNVSAAYPNGTGLFDYWAIK